MTRRSLTITDEETIKLLEAYKKQLGATNYASVVGQAMRRQLPELKKA